MTGVFGGTFDPPHNGHIALARAALEHFALERLVVTVGRVPPLREQPATDAEVRFRLTEAAFGELPRTKLSRFDLDRADVAYSHETVEWAHERFGDVIFLVGADRFADFLDWKAPDEVLRWARLGVATRPGVDRAALDAVLERLSRPERVEFFEIPAVDVSGSEVRRRVSAGEPIDELVPPGVARLVAEYGLYRR